jgi:chemotaxis signal transduction protein
MPRVRMLTFPVGTAIVAVPLAQAREVVSGPVVTPLPTAPPGVLGLFDLHGQVVPLFDAGVLLGLDALEPGPPAYAAVVESHGLLAGLATRGPLAVLEAGAEPAEHVTLLDLDVLLAVAR